MSAYGEVDLEKVNKDITKEEWVRRCAHLIEKLGYVIGCNEQEQQWFRDCGFSEDD